MNDKTLRFPKLRHQIGFEMKVDSKVHLDCSLFWIVSNSSLQECANVYMDTILSYISKPSMEM